MSIPILATKLHIPSPRPNVIHRHHLVEQLNEGLHRRLTLISAPAGFGKTTLIGEWIVRGERPATWLSLDESDSEPARFLAYLIAALQRIVPKIGEAIWASLQSSQPPPIKSGLTNLLNEIATIPDNFLLVLDDFHLIDARAVDKAIAYMLEHLPPQMHLVITTREDPQLPLPRLRARGQMTELRATDLRFTTDEATTFLNRNMGLNLSADDVTSLETRTEGWIAGLQLAALALQGQPSIHGREKRSEFIKTLAGDNRYIVDYLVEEVLQQQPDHIRSFLLQTSILDRLSGPLCDAVRFGITETPSISQGTAVTGQTEGSRLLEILERNNLFVISLDDKRHWYRYHHLFADVLHAYLMREQSEEVPGLHQRASIWYEHNNLPSAAIRHALSAQDFERAAALIEMAWPALQNGFQPATWRDWVKALPDELVSARPVLNVGCAWTLLDEGKLEEAGTCLHIAERLLEISPVNLVGQSKSQAAETRLIGRLSAGAELSQKMVIVNKEAFQTLPASIASARAYLAQIGGDVTAAIQYARRALNLFPEEEHYQRGIAAMFLGLAYWTRGDLEEANQSMADSVANMQLANNVYFQVVGTAMMADLKAEQGYLREAASTYERSLQLATEQGGFVLHETADQYVGLSELYREWNNLETATKHMQKGKNELAEQAILPGSVSRWHTAMARLRASKGNLDGALDALHQAERQYKLDPIPDLRPAAALKARIWVEQDRLPTALGWARERGLSVNDELGYLHEFEYVTLARILIAQYKQDRGGDALHKAMGLLERLLQAAEPAGRRRSVLEILILQALAFQEQGDMSIALATIQRALTLAEPAGYIRIFADEGRPMKAMLAASLAQGVDPVYVTRLIQAIEPQQDVASPPPDPNQLLIEPLSNRELEVLGLLANGFSNKAIADELVIALSTVKKHVNNIFGKLNVASRTQAVNRARDLNIL